jgi:hypothetical protein
LSKKDTTHSIANVFKFLIIWNTVNHILIVVFMTFLITALSIAGTISLNVMAKDNAVGSYRCFPQDDGKTVLCCQLFQGDNKDYKWYCSYCDNTSPPSNCLPRFEARTEGGDIMVPPQEGISDDPQAGDNPNPGIPPTGGVVDETENQNSGNENENDDTSSNTISRKGGDLDVSDLSENVIGQ